MSIEKYPNSHQKPYFLDQNSNDLASRNSEFQKLLLEETRLIAGWLYQKNENTRKSYESDLKKFFAFYRGKTLKEITTAHITVYFKENTDWKASTRARVKSALSSLFKYCIKQRYLDFNPTESMDSIRVPDRTQFKVLSLEEIKRMIELEENPRNRFLISLLFKTGLRVSEACSLTFENFKKRDGAYFLVVVGKGSKTRTIRLDKKYYEWVLEFQEREGELLSKNTPVFRSKNTFKKLTTVSAWKIIKNAALRAGLSGEVSPHWLRHSHATISLQLGDDLRVIQTTLGHDSIATTTKYTAVSPGQSSGQGIEI